MLDLEYPTLVLLDDFQSLVDDYQETISLVRKSSLMACLTKVEQTLYEK